MKIDMSKEGIRRRVKKVGIGLAIFFSVLVIICVMVDSPDTSTKTGDKSKVTKTDNSYNMYEDYIEQCTDDGHFTGLPIDFVIKNAGKSTDKNDYVTDLPDNLLVDERGFKDVKVLYDCVSKTLTIDSVLIGRDDTINMVRDNQWNPAIKTTIERSHQILKEAYSADCHDYLDRVHEEIMEDILYYEDALESNDPDMLENAKKELIDSMENFADTMVKFEMKLIYQYLDKYGDNL